MVEKGLCSCQKANKNEQINIKVAQKPFVLLLCSLYTTILVCFLAAGKVPLHTYRDALYPIQSYGMKLIQVFFLTRMEPKDNADHCEWLQDHLTWRKHATLFSNSHQFETSCDFTIYKPVCAKREQFYCKVTLPMTPILPMMPPFIVRQNTSKQSFLEDLLLK